MQYRTQHSSQRQLSPVDLIRPLLLTAALMTTLAVADQPPTSSSEDARQPGQLQPFNSVVGSWRGVGQPKRGSRRGAWQEKTDCRWDFAGSQPTIRFDTDNGRQFQQLSLSVDAAAKQLVLQQRLDDDTKLTYRGDIPRSWPAKIRLLTDVDEDGARHRCTIEQLSDIRLVMLFERQSSTSGTFRRAAGIGYTRAGHRLARSGSNQRECIVTGGRGTIPVTHDGKTWYVCCEGCRQAFEDAPDEIIAAFLERQE